MTFSTLRKQTRFASIILLFVNIFFGVASARETLYILGTGSVVGLYYPVGGAVSFIVNNAEENMLLTVQVTPGSVSNLQMLQDNRIDLALVQSDVLYEAFNGENAFANAPAKDLRVLMGLHPEPLHLICRKDANVKSIHDIKGKQVNIGNIGSGVLNTVQTVLNAYNIDETTDFTAYYETSDISPELLINGELDCFFFTVGIGGAAIQATATRTPIDLIALDGQELQQLIQQKPYYAFVTVPANTYPGITQDVTLFGVKALLVTNNQLEYEEAYRITRALLQSFETLKETYPALESLILEETQYGLGAPQHLGSMKAYLEHGLIPTNRY